MTKKEVECRHDRLEAEESGQYWCPECDSRFQIVPAAKSEQAVTNQKFKELPELEIEGLNAWLISEESLVAILQEGHDFYMSLDVESARKVHAWLGEALSHLEPEQRNEDCPDGEHDWGAYFCRRCGRSVVLRAAAEPRAPQAPIAKITVRESGAGHYAPDEVSVSFYAPGLPPGDHDVYCEPMSVAPALKSFQARDCDDSGQRADESAACSGTSSHPFDDALRWRAFKEMHVSNVLHMIASGTDNYDTAVDAVRVAAKSEPEVILPSFREMKGILAEKSSPADLVGALQDRLPDLEQRAVRAGRSVKWNCACNDLSCAYCGPRLAQKSNSAPSTFTRECARCGKPGQATRTDGVFYCSIECAD